MICRAAGDDIHLVECLHLLIRKVNGIEVNNAVLHHRIDGVTNHLRLLVNLLEHEVLVATLFGRFCIPLDFRKRLFYDLGINVIECNITLFEFGNLHVADVVNIAGIFENGRNV